MDQEAENVAAQVRHLLTQRGKDAREWERQSKQWEGVVREQRAELDELRASATLAVERCKGLEAQKRALLARITELEQQ